MLFNTTNISSSESIKYLRRLPEKQKSIIFARTFQPIENFNKKTTTFLIIIIFTTLKVYNCRRETPL